MLLGGLCIGVSGSDGKSELLRVAGCPHGIACSRAEPHVSDAVEGSAGPCVGDKRTQVMKNTKIVILEGAIAVPRTRTTASEASLRSGHACRLQRSRAALERGFVSSARTAFPSDRSRLQAKGAASMSWRIGRLPACQPSRDGRLSAARCVQMRTRVAFWRIAVRRNQDGPSWRAAESTCAIRRRAGSDRSAAAERP